MKKVNYKPLVYQNVLIKCVENIDDSKLEVNVKQNIKNFESRSKEYDNLARNSQLYLMNQNFLTDNFTYNNMKFLYSKLRDSPHARMYYDFILKLSTICPYCNEQRSASIDHYLPKSIYPMYAIDPKNLVPSCTDCNAKKKDLPQLINQETLHPYYDDLGNSKWLFCEVVQSPDTGVAFVFKVQKPSDLSNSQFNKIAFHFNKLNLRNMYTILASSEIHSQIYRLKELVLKGGCESLKSTLEESYRSNANVDINSWRTALYEELMNNPWICKVGIDLFEYKESSSDLKLMNEDVIPITFSNRVNVANFEDEKKKGKF